VGIGCYSNHNYFRCYKEMMLRCKLWCHLRRHVSVLCNWSPYSVRKRRSVTNKAIYKEYVRVQSQPISQNKICSLKHSIPCILVLPHTSLITPTKCTIAYIYIYCFSPTCFGFIYTIIREKFASCTSVHVLLRTLVNCVRSVTYYLFIYLLFSLALQPSAGYGLLWLCSLARAMASRSSAA
jgi:hypothetical protein